VGNGSNWLIDAGFSIDGEALRHQRYTVSGSIANKFLPIIKVTKIRCAEFFRQKFIPSKISRITVIALIAT